MATKCVVNKSTMSGIADAIRAKGGTSDAMLPSEMAAKIAAIPSGGGDPYRDGYSWNPPLDWPNLRRMVDTMKPEDYGFPAENTCVAAWLSFNTVGQLSVGLPYSVWSDGFKSAAAVTSRTWSSPAERLNDGTAFRWVVVFFKPTANISATAVFGKGFISWFVCSGISVVPYGAFLNEQSYLKAFESREVLVGNSGIGFLASYALCYFRSNLIHGGSSANGCYNRIFETCPSLEIFERYDDTVDDCALELCAGAIALFSGGYSLKKIPKIGSFDKINGSFSLGSVMNSITRIQDDWDLTGATSVSFGQLKNLQSIPTRIKSNFSFSFSSSVNMRDSESVATFDADGTVDGGMIGNLNVCSNSGQTVTLNATIKELFTEEQQTAIANCLTAKNWGLVW